MDIQKGGGLTTLELGGQSILEFPKAREGGGGWAESTKGAAENMSQFDNVLNVVYMHPQMYQF